GEFRVEIESGKSDREVVIWFSDFGSGVEPGLNELIFQPGFRAPAALKRKATGQGLGLSVVRKIIEAHGRTLQLNTNEEPAKFTITLPISLSETLPPRRIFPDEKANPFHR